MYGIVLHLLADVLSSLAVIVSALINIGFSFRGVRYVDPLLRHVYLPLRTLFIWADFITVVWSLQ